MTARIIQKNTTAFKTVDVDPISLDLIENALKNARDEMDATLFRTAMSPGIREQGDAFPLIADHQGLMLAGQFGSFIQGFLNNYDGEIDEGDIIWLSDPYACEGAVSHANDWLILMPVFVEDRLGRLGGHVWPYDRCRAAWFRAHCPPTLRPSSKKAFAYHPLNYLKKA